MLLRIVVLLLIVLASPLLAQTRHALVVGIDRYDHIPSLQKARNDARAVAGALESAGFRVDTLLDADRRTLLSGLAGFAQRLQPGDEVVFFFAGHGVEANGRNFLLPADLPALRPGDEVLLESDGLPVDRVLSVLTDRGVRAAVLILDACRNNPFPQQAGRSLGGTRGLVPLSPPVGTMVVFSAGKGQEALDRLSDTDPDPNSVFTRRLLPLLTEPGLALHDAARRLRSDVEELAATVRHAQRPAVYDEMRGDFVLVPAAEPAAPVATAPVAPADPCIAARQDWDLITREPAAGAAVLSAFLTAHGNCPTFAALAQDRLARLQAPPATAHGQRPPAAYVAEGSVDLAEDCRRLASPEHIAYADLERGDVQGAIRACRGAVEYHPTDAELAFFLGRALDAGNALEEAYAAYRVAAELGDQSAMTNLSGLYARGLGTVQSYPESIKWLRRAVEGGSARAMNNLGTMYMEGRGVSQDHSEAFVLFRRAAESGDPVGMGSLGYMYEHGLGTPRNAAEAVAWYRRGAELGDANAMGNLGRMYADGAGVPTNPTEAAMWYQRAAERGNPSAFGHLAFAYDGGSGVTRNPLTAAQYFISWVMAEGETAAATVVLLDRDTISFVQRLLSEGGIFSGPADGIAGPATRSALSRLAESN